MKILQDEDLSKYTSVRIGGTAKTMYFPESRDELIDLIKHHDTPVFISGGSNLLINNREFETVINLKSVDSSLEHLGGGRFRAGASVHLQKLINTINKNGYGGIEYLFSVPGLVGGAIVMNAGRGKTHKKCISDYIISVDAIRDGAPITLEKESCGFDYRTSVFKNSNMIVTSVLFKFPEMSAEETAQAKNDRIALCREKQDNSRPNFGSVFMESSPLIMRLARSLKIGGKRVHFSGKTTNWILNEGEGTFQDALNAIQKVERMHKLLGQRCRREVIVIE
nr:FAD-binding protein [uncultured Ruminococcus sp.]